MDNKKASERISIRVTEDDLQKLRMNAADANMSLSQYLIDAGLRTCDIKYVLDYTDLFDLQKSIDSALYYLKGVIPVVMESRFASQRDIELITKATTEIIDTLEKIFNVVANDRNRLFTEAKKIMYNDAKRTKRRYSKHKY